MRGFRVRHIGIVLVTAAMVASCAQHGPTVPPLTQLDGRACATAPDFTQAMPLQFDPEHEKSVEADLKSSAPCMLIGGQPALYSVFYLPVGTDPYIVTIMATPQGENLLAPQIFLYGEQGTLLRSISGTALTFRAGALSALFRSHPDERYLVVASDPKAVGNSMTRIVEATNQRGGAVGNVYYTIYSGTDIAATYTLSHIGHFSVTIAAVPVIK